MPPAQRTRLSVTAERADDKVSGSVFIPELPAVEHILIDEGQHQHVLFRGNGAVLQLEIQGADIVSGPVSLSFTFHGIDNLNGTEGQIRELRRILSSTAAPDTVARWTVRKSNMRDGLVVYDFKEAGHRYRDAAILIHGAQVTQQDWRKGALPARMRRDWLRAKQFVSGGWRSLVR